MALVFALSGAIGSGKTSVSRALSVELGWPRCAFGDQVRSEARMRGLDPSQRDVLQELGKELVACDPEAFCRATLDQAGGQGMSLVLDGVRHIEILEIVRRVVEPAPVVLVYLDVIKSQREARLASAGRDQEKSLIELDRHSTECQVRDRIREAADLVIDGSKPLPQLVQELRIFAAASNRVGPQEC